MNKKDICEKLCPKPCIDAEIICQWAEDINNYVEQQIENLKIEILDYENIIKLQRSRTIEADKLWQEENNKSNIYPDLGDLIKWLLVRHENLKCCGNCKKIIQNNYSYGYKLVCDNLNSKNCGYSVKHNEYCLHWQSDGLTQEDRK